MASLVLYDGYCVLCNTLVAFIAPRQKTDSLEFASLQSPRGQTVLKECGLSMTMLDTFVLKVNGHCYTRSEGALRLTRYLRFPWPLLYALILVPGFIREAIYNSIARNRFRWFGRTDA
jgi:predicted DCC family thiol-disulfide oxidoreductase YuxK